MSRSSVMTEADLLIVGGGILGTFHAYHAAERGLRVVLLERDAKPLSATVRNFGQVVPSGLDRHWQRFGRESLAIYKQLQAEHDISVRHQGSIYLASNEEELTLLEELHTINRSEDYLSELWTAEQCRQRYPALRAEYCQCGLYFPEEVSVNPRKMIYQLQARLADHPHLTMCFNTFVVELHSASADRVVAISADGHEFHASQAIVCNGSDFQSLFPERFRESDLTAVKLQMMRLKSQSEVSLPGNVLTGLSIRRYESFSECPSWRDIKAREDQETFCQRFGIHILFKQELDGSIILGDSHEYASVADVSNLSFDIRNDINDVFISEGRKIFDLPTWDAEASWIGIYCQTKDPSGIYRTTIDDNIHVVTGIGGKGMTSSAGFAKSVLKDIYND